MMKSLAYALILSVAISGCSTSQNIVRDPAFAKAQTGLDKGGFANQLKKFGYRPYYGNLHAHHYMGPKAGDQTTVPTACDSAYPQDDGRPCRNNAQGENKVVTEPNADPKFSVVNYFKEACRYAANEGELNILWITPHSKNNGVQVQPGQKPDTDTVLSGYEERHRLMPELNTANGKGGKFFCGLGQEASSISAGNHINIFGQFKTDSRDTRPFFFQTGDFAKLFSEVKERRARGEKIVLQMNHPESDADTWWKLLSEAGNKLKESLNDYGLDDYAPIGCMVKTARKLPLPAGCKGTESEWMTKDAAGNAVVKDQIDMALLKKTFANIREANGDSIRLIEFISPAGATSNPATDFKKVHSREDPNAFAEGLRDYVYYLTMGFKLGPTANQDNHHMNFGSATASRTGILAQSLNEDDIIDAFENRRTFATEDVNAGATLSIGDTFMGGELETREDGAILSIGYKDLNPGEKTASIRVYLYDEKSNPDFTYRSKPEAWVRLYPATASVDSGSVTLMRVPLKVGKQFVFVELTQGDNDKIFTAPIWITRK